MTLGFPRGGYYWNIPGMRTSIPANIKNELAKRTHCENKPHSYAPGCKGYICPLWKSNNGLFDESGFQIDHIVEVTHSGTNEISNLQVLCPCCHSVKTKRCAKQKWDFTSHEIDIGCSHMETESKKRKRELI